MIYPKFLKTGDLIGITALSSGCNDCLDELQLSINNLRKNYQVLVTNDCYGNSLVSDTKEIRAKEFNDLLENNLKMIYIARGGDFLIETLPLIDFEKIKNNPIWIQGYSDPTSLLYLITCKYDIATIYGINGKGYDSLVLQPYQKNNLEIIKGNLITQKSFMDRNTTSLNGNFNSSGVIIGGCIDVLKDIVNSQYDYTSDFINRYKNKNIVWYFDNYSLSSKELMNVLIKFKENNWFKYSNTFLFGTEMFSNEDGLSYIEAIKKVFDNDCYNIVVNANIGHIKPSFTMINGSFGKISFSDGILSINQELMEDM